MKRLNATSIKHAHCYVVPADDKDNTHGIASHVVVDAFKQLKMAPSKVNVKQNQELDSIKRLLTVKPRETASEPRASAHVGTTK